MGNSGSTSSDIASKEKKFLETLFYVQHVNKSKDTARETCDQNLKDYLLKNDSSQKYSDSVFAEYLRNDSANLIILKESLKDRVTFVKICSNPLPNFLQLSDVPIHEFVVFMTENYSKGKLKRTWWSLETNGQQIVLQQSPNQDDVINKIYDTEKKESVERSARPVRDRENDWGPFRMNVKDVLQAILDNNQLSEPYHFVTSNSQLFASFIYEKISATVIGLSLSKVDAFKYRSILYDQHFDCYRALMEERREDFEELIKNLTIETLNRVDSQGYTLLAWATVFSRSDWRIDEELKGKFPPDSAEITPNEREKFDRNVLFIALQYIPPQKKKKIFNSFNGFDINGVNGTGDTALHLALYGEKWEPAGAILNKLKDYEVNLTNSFEDTPLHLAAKLKCEIGLFQQILNRTNSENVNKTDGNGWTALHYAIDKKSGTKVEELLKRDDVNVKNNEDNSTPLHLAANWQNIPLDLFKNLFQKSKEKSTDLINAKDKNGNTALHIACLKNSQNAINVLLENEVTVNIKNNENRTPLHCATMRKDISTDWYTKILDKSNSDTVNVKDNDGNTALHLALLFRFNSAVEELLNADRVDVDIQNNEKDTALGLASKLLTTFPSGLFKKILDKSKNINAKDKDGNTPLHIAILSKSKTGVRELLEYKNVNVDVKNNSNRTVYCHASDYWKDIPQDLLKIISKKSVGYQRRVLLSIFIAIIAIGYFVLFCMQINTSFLVFKTETP